MKILLWRGLINKSWEHCSVDERDSGFKIASEIVGNYEGETYMVNYLINTDNQWNIQDFEIRCDIQGEIKRFYGQKNGLDWLINGQIEPCFAGFNYIDISITPLTNTLPIKRLALNVNESKDINVIYIDILNGSIKPVRERYTKISKDHYRYENLESTFASAILIDRNGIVKTYPGHFELVA